MRRMRDRDLWIVGGCAALLLLGSGVWITVKRRTPSSSLSLTNTKSRSTASEVEHEEHSEAEKPSNPGLFSSLVRSSSPEEGKKKKSDSPLPGSCGTLEYPGEGFQHTHISSVEWNHVVEQFRQGKKLLGTWLKEARSSLPDKTYVFMTDQLEAVKLTRPPSVEEPDLSWRGIGVFTRDEKNSPEIRLSGGFIKWAQKNPKRTLFEFTRLIAQSWAPCELQRADARNPWEALLKCLSVSEEQACAGGSYSEGGWAVSTSLAFVLSHPGCQVPAFQSSASQKCLEKISFSSSLKGKRK